MEYEVMPYDDIDINYLKYDDNDINYKASLPINWHGGTKTSYPHIINVYRFICYEYNGV